MKKVKNKNFGLFLLSVFLLTITINFNKNVVLANSDIGTPTNFGYASSETTGTDSKKNEKMTSEENTTISSSSQKENPKKNSQNIKQFPKTGEKKSLIIIQLGVSIILVVGFLILKKYNRIFRERRK